MVDTGFVTRDVDRTTLLYERDEDGALHVLDPPDGDSARPRPSRPALVDWCRPDGGTGWRSAACCWPTGTLRTDGRARPQPAGRRPRVGALGRDRARGCPRHPGRDADRLIVSQGLSGGEERPAKQQRHDVDVVVVVPLELAGEFAPRVEVGDGVDQG